MTFIRQPFRFVYFEANCSKTMNHRTTQIPYSLPTMMGMACILLIMTGTLISACDSTGSNGDESSTALIPLNEGNRWEADIDGGESGTAVAEVTASDEVDLTLNFEGDPVEATLNVSEESDGLLLESLVVGGDVEESDILLLKYPAEEGDTYQHTDGDGTTYEVSVSETSISVPAGDYDGCLQYTISLPDIGSLSTVTVKPGVGPLEWEGGDATYELTETNVDQ